MRLLKIKNSYQAEGPNSAIWRTFFYLLLLVIAVVTLYPIFYVIFGSLKTNQELLLGGTNLLPKEISFDNYKQAWEKANFASYTLNSLIIATGVMLVSVLVSSMAGYVFARKDFRFKSVLYGLFVAFMFINVGSMAIRPLFELAVKLGMDGSLISVILISAGMAQASYIFLMTGNIKAVPKELDEAARIDGCNFFQIYWKVILPTVRPALATIAILSFRTGWNEYILPNVFSMANEKIRPLTVGVVMLKSSGDGAAAWNIMFAGGAISIIPIIIIYILFSKSFMAGSTSGAVKG